jgi:hypothetical protein
MRKLILVLMLAICAGVSVSAQATDYNESEFYIGYSNGQVDGSTSRFIKTSNDFGEIGPLQFHGVGVAGVYNFGRYFGVKGDVSATFHGGDFTIPVNTTTTISGTGRNSLYNVLGGVQIKDNKTEGRIKPFAHFLVGLGHARTSVTSTCSPSVNCTNVFVTPSSTETGIAGAFGGGLDVRINNRFDFRVAQIDYNPVKLDSGTLHNVRFGIGIVIK